MNHDYFARMNWKMMSFPHKLEVLREIGFNFKGMTQDEINAMNVRSIQAWVNGKYSRSRVQKNNPLRRNRLRSVSRPRLRLVR